MNEGESALPFIHQSGKELGKGAVSRIWEYDDKWVIKEVTRSGELNTFKALQQNKKDYELLKKSLYKHTPETHFVRGVNANGEPTNFIVQKRIKGKPINKISDIELKDPGIKSNLKHLLEQTLNLWNETGRLPDLLGNFKAVVLGPRYTPNIVIEADSKNCYLVDTDANPKVFSKYASVLYIPRVYLSAWNIKRYIKKL